MTSSIKLLYLVFLFITIGCTTVKKSGLNQYIESSNCNQENLFDYGTEEMPKPLHKLEIDERLLAHFSRSSLNVANAVGLLDDLHNYLEFSKNDLDSININERFDLLELRQRINYRVNISSLDVSAIASEIDCEEERIEQIANFIQQKEGKLETNLTVAAIVTGAIGAILSGVIVINDVEDNRVEYVGITAGLSEVLLGSLLLVNKRKIIFKHDRNLLQDLWERKEVSSVFPPSIWYYLNYTDPNDESVSVSEEIIDKWMKFGQLTDSKEKKKGKLIQLYFKDGGKYTSEQLINRANMHDQLESQINLMKQDLMLLSHELELFYANY